MSNVLVIGELSEGKLRKVAFEMMSSGADMAQQTSGKADAVVLGPGAEAQAPELAKYGADTVYVSEDSRLQNYSGQLFSETIIPLIKEKGYSVVLLGATLAGKDLGPILASRLETGMSMDSIDYKVEGDRVVFTRPMYSGKVISKVKVKSDPQIATVRSNNFPMEEKSGAGNIEKIEVASADEKVKVLDRITAKSDRVDATEASVVVSGGRGMKSAENFKMLEDLADLLGAGLGASRAATDAGWRPHSDQIGQTGKVISPNLYIACGISGAIQHLAGCGSSKYIVAVNKDPEAPIFKVATFGIVHDLHEFVPVFTEEVKKAIS